MSLSVRSLLFLKSNASSVSYSTVKHFAFNLSVPKLAISFLFFAEYPPLFLEYSISLISSSTYWALELRMTLLNFYKLDLGRGDIVFDENIVDFVENEAIILKVVSGIHFLSET